MIDKIKDFFFQETLIEKMQSVHGQNINDLELDFKSEAIPQIPEEIYFEDGNIFISKHHRYAPMPAHRHAFVELNYMLSGKSNHRINGEEIFLEQGEILMLDKNSIQEIDALSKNDILINILIKESSISTELIVNMIKSSSVVNEFLLTSHSEVKQKYPHLIFRTGNNKRVQDLIENMLIEFFEKKPYYMRSLNLNLSILLIEMTRLLEAENLNQQNICDNELLNLLSYIEKNYKEATLSIIAKEFGYNKDYLSYKLKKQTGSSFQELLNNIRFKKAYELIAETNLSFERIAEIIGYNSTAALYKLCAKYTQMRPSEIRNQRNIF
ncbi:AraC family transcriptional regulator [Enterococcus sp. RIT-PI-f]|uniref:AraC family transcriptional regulator n=1 Tax=Enterococcus sp. RIT-PI-f TaxID=1690244 RepID=UPI0006B8C383|nr:AraC family transcriptional regulator [Enterococcus sp. RIT-PI-f]